MEALERSDRWLGESVSGGSGEGEQSLVEGSDCWWRGAVLGGGELSQVEGSNHRWRRAIAGGGE